jgi:two-component system cell cycle sensor histidine kinase/response regulator CckA
MCPQAATTIGPRLLLVDDDERTVRLLASMLTEDGFVVEVMLSGEEAIERLARDPPPDAIVTDLVMPVVGGIAVLGEARKRRPLLPVVFVTGRPELLAKIRFEPSPIVFTKPVSYADLSAKLREVLAKRPPT